MSEDDTPNDEPRIGPHLLRSRVRPELPPNAEPWTLVWVNRDGHVVIPIQDRPEQRIMIEREGGVWDPARDAWTFTNVKKRDACQREIDEARVRHNGNVQGTSCQLAPGLNLIGAELWAELERLPATKRLERYLEAVPDPTKVKPSTLIDYVKRTGVIAVLRYLLTFELADAVIKAVTKQLEDLEGGRKPTKVSRTR